jgi:cell division septation protein DedD
MKRVCLFLSVLMILSLLLFGCSREKPSSKPAQKTVIKEPIIVPVEKEATAQTPPAAAPTTPPVQAKAEENKAQAAPQEKGIYIAKGNETLAVIAAKKEIYGDPLKWIILYRHNKSVFDKTAKDALLPDKQVPAGTRLKVASPAPRPGKYWVVNVLSFPQQEKIVPDAVTLSDNGYPAYIIKANVKGVDYLRLRVGFFSEKTAAESEGKKIAAMLNIADVWTTRPDETEVKEFGGYE